MNQHEPKDASPNRRKVVLGLAAAGASLALPFAAPRALAQSRAPFKIGVLNTFSKSEIGVTNFKAMNLYFDEIGWQAGGRKIEVVREDDEMNPQVGLQKLRKLVESDKVDIVFGPQGSNVAMAIVDYIRSSKTFLLISGAGITSLAWEKIPYMFRSSTTVAQICHPIGEWVYDNGAKEIVTVGADYSGGRDTINEFKLAYLAKGGKIIKEIWVPLNTADYSPYLIDIRSIAPKMTFNFFFGADAVRYVKQYDEFGLKAKTKLTGFAVVEGDTIPGQGKAALGGITSAPWTDQLDNAENKKFVAAYRAKYNAYPDFYAEYGYTGAKVIGETLKATNGESSDKDRFAKAMVNVKFNAPRGPFAFDPATNNQIQHIYIREAVELEGRIVNKVIATYKDVRCPPTKRS